MQRRLNKRKVIVVQVIVQQAQVQSRCKGAEQQVQRWRRGACAEHVRSMCRAGAEQVHPNKLSS